MALSKKMIEYVEETEREALDLLVELAKIPAPSNHEEKRAAFCLEWLERQGAEGVYVDEALNLVCPVGDCGGASPLTVFMAHSDTVFPDTEEMPLKMDRSTIHCPGVGDDNAGVVGLLMSVRYVLREKLVPREGGVLFVVNSGEEGLGNLKGSRKIVETYGTQIRHFYSIDGWNGNITSVAVGSQRFHVRLKTEGGHSYLAFGNRNAIAHMASLIDSLYALKPPQGATYNVGMIQGGTSVNTIAQDAEILYEFRADNMAAMEQMQKHFDACIEYYRQKGITIQVEIIGERPCTGDVDQTEEAAMMERANQAHLAYFGKEANFVASSTDCNIPLSLGIPSLCIDSFMGGGAHSREEYVLIDSLMPGRKLVMDMIMHYFQVPQREEANA